MNLCGHPYHQAGLLKGAERLEKAREEAAAAATAAKREVDAEVAQLLKDLSASQERGKAQESASAELQALLDKV